MSTAKTIVKWRGMIQLWMYLPVVILMCMSCEEQNEWQLEPEDTGLIIVESLLTNELKQHEVLVSRPSKALNDERIPVNDAIVVLISDDTVVLHQSPDVPGTYLTDSLRGVTGKPYILGIWHQGKTYGAYAYMEPVSPIGPIKIVPEDTLFRFEYTNSNDPSMMEVTYHIPWQGTLLSAKEYYYTLKSIDVNQLFPPDKEKIHFTKGTMIIRKKYSLTDNHQDFIRSLLMETDWRGGMFDVAQGNVVTNFSDGARGFFAASTVVVDTVIVE